MDPLKTELSRKVLKDLGEDPEMWKWMLWLTEIPRGSYHTEKCGEAIMGIAKDLGLPARKDEGGNIIISKPASKGCEKLPTVCLQAHYDMVVEAEDPNFDKLNDRIVPRVDGDWLKATGTSLGADDGIGVAIGLAILEDKTAEHPPLEFLITNDEEVGMKGVNEMAKDLIPKEVKYMINLDSEEADAICLGCAGGENAFFKLKHEKESVKDEATTSILNITLSGFNGGHSGCDIHKGLANPVKVFGRLLIAVRKAGIEFNLHSMDIGNSRNAIPRSGKISVAVSDKDVEAMKKILVKVQGEIAEEYAVIEKTPELNIERQPLSKTDCKKVLSKEKTLKVVNFLKLCPSNPTRMSPIVTTDVESSGATTIATLNDDHTYFQILARTSRATQFDEIEQDLELLAEVCDGEVEFAAKYYGWMPVADSSLVKKAEEAYRKLFNKAPKKYTVHAGLECGVLMAMFPQVTEAISLGPQLEGPHSPGERCGIKSSVECHKLTCEILRGMCH